MAGCPNIIELYVKQTLDGSTISYVKEKRMFWCEKQKYDIDMHMKVAKVENWAKV